MFRFNEQYVWQVVFLAFFVLVVLDGVFILEDIGYRPVGPVTPFEFVILALATYRLTRLVVYDSVTAFFRDQFFDAKKGKRGEVVFEKPARGPRRTLAELVGCPWCFGMWAGATVLFFFFLTPYAWFPLLLLAVAGVGTFIQLAANFVGWKAERMKQEVKENE